MGIRENEKGGDGNLGVLQASRDQLHQHRSARGIAPISNASVWFRLSLLAKLRFRELEAVHALIILLQCTEVDQIGRVGWWGLRRRQIHHLRSCGPLSIVECVGIAGFEIHKTCNLSWMRACLPAQLCTGNRVSCQDRLIQLECIEHSQNVFSQPLTHVSPLFITGSAESSSRDSIDMIVDDQLGREIVKYMRSVPTACQKYDCSAGAAPIQDF